MLSDNLKYLRKLNGLSQQTLADEMSIPRTTLGDYERGYTEPNVETLIRLANYYKVSTDELLKTKLQFGGTPSGPGQLKVLAISTDLDNNENIELVETKAAAGYLDSYQDPEYIKDLPKIQFPNIPTGTYRGFEIRGDSMLPVEPGSIIISKYVENLREIKDGKTYIVVSKENGVVYKRLKKDDPKNQMFMISDNEQYLPYSMEYSELDEIWEYYAHLSFSDNKAAYDGYLEDKLADIQKKLAEMHQKLVD